ncbi:hypothetical protein [Azorhizobium doebereinerae]|uniref:hypothetical protein n=1 Tax=Azorhizobium doebereinerae TaxID=281091 RepID=UPI00040F7271|nr:hypothetical protein [Azorhizobium doebereinerae]
MTLAAASLAPARHRGFSAPALADVGRWLVGRPAEDAVRLLPRVYNLCAAAHGAASAAALGLPDPDGAAPRAEMMRAETVRDHGLALFHQWPQMLGLPGEREALALLGRAEAGAVIAARVGGEADLPGLSLSDLDLWLARGATLPARLLRAVRDRLDPAWGCVPLAPLTLADLDMGLDALRRPDAALPARDATVLERVRHAPVLAALLAREGPSLFVRLLARVVDLLFTAAGRAGPAAGRTEGGAGFAAAARGLLAHGARTEGGRIAAYAVLPPSAWTLAPAGLLERMLDALPARRETPMLGQWVLAAVNPCVPVTLAGQGG